MKTKQEIVKEIAKVIKPKLSKFTEIELLTRHYHTPLDAPMGEEMERYSQEVVEAIIDSFAKSLSIEDLMTLIMSFGYNITIEVKEDAS